MKRLILFCISVFLCGFLSAQDLVSADSIWNKIRIETVKGANTASRVGTAGQYIVDGVRDTLANFATTSGTNTLINDTLSVYSTTAQTRAIVSDSLDLAVRLTGAQTINGAKRFTSKIQFDAYADQTIGGNALGVSLQNAGGHIFLTNDTITFLTDYESIMVFTKDSILPQKPISGYMTEQDVQSIVSDSLAGVVTIANPQLILGLKSFQNGIITRIVDENELSVFGGDQFYTAVSSGGNELIIAENSGLVAIKDSTGNFTIKCDDDSIRFYKPTNIPVAYGGIHCHDNSTPQSIPTGATYTKITAFTDAGLNYKLTCAADSMVAIVEGDYLFSGSFSMTSGTNNVVCIGSLFVNNTEYDNIHFSRKIGTGTDIGSASFTGIAHLEAGDVLTFRVRHDNVGSVNFTFQYANLNTHLLRNY